MAIDIGPKIGIDGEAEFRKQINTITQQIKTFGSEMQAVTSEFGKNQDSMEALTAKNEVLNKSIDAQSQKLEELKKGLHAASAQYGENDTKTLKWQQAVNQATADLNKMQNELKDNQSAMDQFGTETDDTAAAMDEAGDSATRFSDVLKANLASEAIVGAVSAIKDAVIELGKELVNYSLESENASVKATAYFGETGEAAKQTEQIIKDVYTGGVGESMDQVSDAVIAVKKNLEDLSATDMKNITDQAITLDSLYGIDMNETLRGVNALMEQFGLDAQTAMDYVVSGTQNGLDKTNELGDNLAEYSGKFEQAGYTAEEYFQLLNNGLDGGAYNLDKVNDAINEVTTRLADGTIADTIESYSTETQDLFKAWQNGGASQKEVIDSIVKDIKNTSSQQDALNMAASAFGTMAEDGNLKFITSLSSVGNAYKDVSGKAQDMFDSTTTSQQLFDAAMRQAKEDIAPVGNALVELGTELIPQIAEAFGDFVEQIDWDSVTEQITGIADKIHEFCDFLAENKDTILAVLAAIAAGFVAWNVASIVQGAITAIQGLGGVLPAIKTGIAAVNTVIAANPIGLVVTAIAALVAGLVVAYNTSDTFREKVDAAFSAIKDVVLTVIEAVKEAVTAAWAYISTDTGGQLGIMQAYVNAIFQEIKLIISVVMTAIQGIIKAVTQAMNGDWSGAWNTIKETVFNIVGQIKEYVLKIFGNLLTGIKTTVGNISAAVKNGLQTAVDYVSSLPAKFLKWGSDMIDNLIAGIKSGINAVGNAVESIADKISSFLHFSEPDEGPLSNFHTFMPDMTKLMVSGIRAGIPDVEKAIHDLSSVMVPQYANGTTAAYEQITSRLGNMQVVLEDGTLVGKVSPRVNASLGGIKTTEGRYHS